MSTDTSLGTAFPRTREQLAQLRAKGLERAKDLLRFIDASPTPYHAVAEITGRLKKTGFAEVRPETAWTLAPGDRAFVVYSGTVIAFVVGTQSPATAGYKVLGAHTDSPNLKLKPNTDVARQGYRQLGVEPYGGVLLASWFDRDLSLAGRVSVRGAMPGQVDTHLLDFARPLLRIAHLSYHLQRDVNTAGLVVNPQQHTIPIIGLEGRGPASARALVAAELESKGLAKVRPEDVLDFNLSVYDTQKGIVSGQDGEFVHSARLDNLGSCHAGTVALVESLVDGARPSAATRVLACFDHEECGSKSATGAQSPALRSVLERILEAVAPNEAQGFGRAMARSFLVSADMAHAVHPNFVDKHEPEHLPKLNAGPVIKRNANQSYATDGAASAQFEAWCHEVGFQPQRFVTRSDIACGNTIGPIAAALLGVQTVDVGNPMLSMHSVREMGGTLDSHLMIEVLKRFFS